MPRKLKSEFTPDEWERELAKQRERYARRHADSPRELRKSYEYRKITISVPLGQYAKLKAIAAEQSTIHKQETPHGVARKSINDYVQAWLMGQSLIPYGGSDDRLTFMLLALLKSLTKTDEQYWSVLNAAIRAHENYGTLDVYLAKHDSDN